MSNSNNQSIRDGVQKIKNDLNQKLNETVEVVVDSNVKKEEDSAKEGVNEGITPK